MLVSLLNVNVLGEIGDSALNIPAAFVIELMYCILVSAENFSTSNTIPTGYPVFTSTRVS